MLAPEHRELLEANFATHTEPDDYDPRGVLLFGAAEIIRSRMCVGLLEAGHVGRFGELMKVSHDGDRVCRAGPDGAYRPMVSGCSDLYLQQLCTDLASEDPDRVLRGQLYMQPGSYACSTPEIDQMADIAAAVPGVAGARLPAPGWAGA